VLVANYMGGNVTVFPVQPDGSLGAAVANVSTRAKGVNAKRQEAPHAHNVVLTRPTGSPSCRTWASTK
jgi:6-phosphogluconolactonase